MASRPAVRTLLRLTRRLPPRPRALAAPLSAAQHQHQHTPAAPPAPSRAAVAAAAAARPFSTSPARQSKAYTFDEVKSLSENPTPERIIIDVREPGEFAAGAIPTALNIPVTSAPDALLLPADEFEERFGFAKPAADTALVFYCKAGVRSAAAARLASQAGWRDVGEYKGSWMDWEKNGGAVAR